MNREEQSRQSGSWIRGVDLVLPPPSLSDNTADAERVLKGSRKILGTRKVRLPLRLAATLPALLRTDDYRLRIVAHEDEGVWRITAALPPAAQPRGPHGLAVDLGTTTVGVRLVDLLSGERLAETAFRNPQGAFGADILTRIHHSARARGLMELQTVLVRRLNHEIRTLAERHDVDIREIHGLAAAGNTTMTHLFLGLNPHWICREPYIPVVNRPGLIRAADLSVDIHPEAPVLVLPNVGSYCGGDLIAGILASGLNRQEEVAFLVDVGTNAEVVVGNRDWLMACAGAAGPALEGGVAGMGMMAAPGVIDHVEIDPVSGALRVEAIKDRPPIGICGSGLIDLVAELFSAGCIDMRGKFVPARCGPRLRAEAEPMALEIVAAEDSGTGAALTLSQADLDALIRSKAAMYTILTTVSNTTGIPLDGIRRFYVAGTFGTYIRPRSAITLGMIPDLPPGSYIPLGNSSLEGATRALLSAGDRDEVTRIRDRVTYLELNVNQEFMNLYSAARFIPHTDRSRFPSVVDRAPRAGLDPQGADRGPA